MIQLTSQNIRIGARAGSKNEAIRAAGQVLVESGFIEPGYIESMIGREGQANTYLGNGISHPARNARDRELIRAQASRWFSCPMGSSGGREKSPTSSWESRPSPMSIWVFFRRSPMCSMIRAKAELLAKTKDPNDIIAGLSRAADESAGEPRRSHRRLRVRTTWTPKSWAAPECMRDRRPSLPTLPPNTNRIFGAY
jgi:phosphocarrier protein FPr